MATADNYTQSAPKRLNHGRHRNRLGGASLGAQVSALLVVAFVTGVAGGTGGCSALATIERTDGVIVRGKLIHDDDDIIVMRSAVLKAPRSARAPWTTRRGRGAWVKRAVELAIAQEEILQYTVENRHAFKAGLAGSIITGVSLIILVPSAIELNDGGFGTGLEELGVIFGATALTAGLVTAIVGWAVYGDSYRNEPGGGAILAPSPPEADY